MIALPVLALIVATNAPAAARHIVVEAVASVDVAKTTVLDRHHTDSGALVGGAIGVWGRRIGVALDVEVQAFDAVNPVIAETYRTVFVIPAFAVRGARGYARVGVGPARIAYERPDRNFSETSACVGARAGIRLGAWTPTTSLEAAVRWTWSGDLELASRQGSVGVRLSFGGN